MLSGLLRRIPPPPDPNESDFSLRPWDRDALALALHGRQWARRAD